MGKNRYAKNIDKNQPYIVKKLRQIPGVSVDVDHNDIFVGCQNLNFWYEIKSDNAVSKKSGNVLESKIRDNQKDLRSTWRGHYKIMKSFEEITADMNSVFKRFNLGLIRL